MDQQFQEQDLAGQHIDRNQQGVTGQQSTNTTAHHQLNSIYDTKRADDIKDVLPEYQKSRHDVKNLDLSRGVKYGGVADATDQKSNTQKSAKSADVDTRQSKADVSKAGIKMPPNGAGECKVLRREPLVSIF